MICRLFVLALSIPVLAAIPPKASADELAGVVELYTSQGCSSCPPADATLGRLVQEGDVLALGFHVDYWNYLGWEDTLSSPANTERQYGYARSLNRKSVYTPQAVINGRDHVNGSDHGAIRAKLKGLAAEGQGLTIPVDVKTDGEGLTVRIGGGTGKGHVVAVYYDRATTVEIASGENTGKSITYHNSVRDLETIGMWSGKAMSFELPASVLAAHPGGGLAVLLQSVSPRGTPGVILGAGRIETAP